MDGIILKLIEKAKEDKKRIVLPESEDIRVVTAAKKIADLEVCNIILIGDKEEIEQRTGVNLDKVTVINNLTADNKEEYANFLYNLRKEKGMTIEEAKHLMEDRVYYGVVMVKKGEADGLVSGANHSTAQTLRPALQIIKTRKDAKCVSSFMIMEVPGSEFGKDGIVVFGDCGLIQNPTSEELAEIAYQASLNFKKLVEGEPKVAMLSYSTKGSAKGPEIDKVVEGYNIAKTLHPEMTIDGELQLDAALVKEVGELKCPGSCVAGSANVLIFPSLEAGNIGYKLVQRFAKGNAYGPLTQGLAKPVNDLSRGCNVEDIVGAVAVTALQVEN